MLHKSRLCKAQRSAQDVETLTASASPLTLNSSNKSQERVAKREDALAELSQRHDGTTATPFDAECVSVASSYFRSQRKKYAKWVSTWCHYDRGNERRFVIRQPERDRPI